jgi:hypothetical protein
MSPTLLLYSFFHNSLLVCYFLPFKHVIISCTSKSIYLPTQMHLWPPNTLDQNKFDFSNVVSLIHILLWLANRKPLKNPTTKKQGRPRVYNILSMIPIALQTYFEFFNSWLLLLLPLVALGKNSSWIQNLTIYELHYPSLAFLILTNKYLIVSSS